eukprot:694523-Rhodomonas_salina.1
MLFLARVPSSRNRTHPPTLHFPFARLSCNLTPSLAHHSLAHLLALALSHSLLFSRAANVACHVSAHVGRARTTRTKSTRTMPGELCLPTQRARGADRTEGEEIEETTPAKRREVGVADAVAWRGLASEDASA